MNINIPLHVDAGDDISLNASPARVVPMGVDTTITAAIMPHYTGPTNITPIGEPQVLETRGMALDEDITIGSIPSNYGLITWDGSVLTVS